MDFNEYQQVSRRSAIYPNLGPPGGPFVGWIYPALGLGGEAGEIAEKIKKIARDENYQLSTELKLSIRDELGDLLWYLSQLATEVGLTLDEIATSNTQKLQSRAERGTVHGHGDMR